MPAYTKANYLGSGLCDPDGDSNSVAWPAVTGDPTSVLPTGSGVTATFTWHANAGTGLHHLRANGCALFQYYTDSPGGAPGAYGDTAWPSVLADGSEAVVTCR